MATRSSGRLGGAGSRLGALPPGATTTVGAGGAGATATGVLGVGPITLHGTGTVTATTVSGVGILRVTGLSLHGTGGAPTPPIIVPPQIGLAPPLVVVEVSFAANPQDAPIWVAITAQVMRLTIERGRQRELNRIEASRCSIELYDPNRVLDSTNSAGPYYGQILPMRRIRVRATYNNSSYPLWAGYVESWGQQWPSFADSVVTIDAVDAFKVLNLAQLNTSFPAQTSDERVSAVLNTVGWTVGGASWTIGVSLLGLNTIVGPTGDRTVGPGASTIQASTLANTSALSHLQDVNDTEMGLLYTDRVGAVTFYGRAHAALPAQTANQATFGELELPYVDIALSYDDTNIWNQVVVTRQGGTAQTANYLPSQTQYYLRTLSMTSTLHDSDLAAHDLAFALVVKYSIPALQVISMTLDGEANPTLLYPQMLGRELGDRVTVRRRPLVGSTIEQISTIQGINISYDANGDGWAVVWRLAPADITTYWLLGDSVQSLLGSTTILGF